VFPLKDDVPSRTTPFVTIGLIALNVLVFLYQVSLQGVGSPEGVRAARDFVLEFGLVPCRLTGDCARGGGLLPPALTVLTSMFVHGGIIHVGGNMLYLWIFGDNVEDTLGHCRFVVFYLACGAVAAIAQTLLSAASSLPMIGASGAVSGVLGAYLLLFPRANVLTIIVFGFFVRLVRIPAVIMLGIWFLVQFLGGLVMWAPASRGGAADGGTAWFAHLGGFLAGMGLCFVLRPRDPRGQGPSRSW
jgi:membrane associated rhomboid family serine protease